MPDLERTMFGLGCFIGVSSLCGTRGTVEHLCRDFRKDGPWCEIELWDGRTVCVPEADVWRQDDPSRPWGHGGWF